MSHDYFFVMQITVGLLFFMSSVGKLADPIAFANGVIDYAVGPKFLAYPGAAAIIVGEGFIAISHLSGWQLAIALKFSLGLMSAFFVVVVLNLWRGRILPCYCFGGHTDEVISRTTLVRLIVIGALEYCLLRAHSSWTIVSLSGEYKRNGLGGLVGNFILALGLVQVGMWTSEVTNLLALLRSMPRQRHVEENVGGCDD